MKKYDFVPVLIVFGGVKNSERDLSVFDIEKINAPRVIDKTRFAGRESWGGAVIGAPVSDDLDNLPSNKEIDKICSTEIIIPELLEGGKEDER